MPSQYRPKNAADGVVKLYDNGGVGGANVLTFLDVGDFKCDLPNHARDVLNANVDIFGKYFRNMRRGRFTGEILFSAAEEISFSFTCDLASFVGGATLIDNNAFDAMMANPSGSGAIDLWTPTNQTENGTSMMVPTYGLRWYMEGTSHGEGKDHSIAFTRVILKVAVGEGEDKNTLSVSGTAQSATPA